MDIFKKYKTSAKHSKTAYFNILNKKKKGYEEEINKINAEIANLKKNKPDDLKIKLKH